MGCPSKMREESLAIGRPTTTITFSSCLLGRVSAGMEARSSRGAPSGTSNRPGTATGCASSVSMCWATTVKGADWATCMEKNKNRPKMTGTLAAWAMTRQEADGRRANMRSREVIWAAKVLYNMSDWFNGCEMRSCAYA